MALAALALTASAVLAAAGPGAPRLAQTGANDPTATAEASEAPEATESPEPSETPEASEAPDASGAPTDTHGSLVSTAAQMTTPPGFDNHGAFVSCVARMHGVTLSGFDWTTVTPGSCASAEPGHGHHGGHQRPN
ncbi:MAG TPA: hypothetical protein VKR30_01295 [Candidatus Limnocylindrales bacterium]|nr:hypothetical protein [Candidatus Limnocylindrales bacterium]